MLLKANNQFVFTRKRLYIDRLARYYVFHQVSSTQFVKTGALNDCNSQQTSYLHGMNNISRVHISFVYVSLSVVS
jgi:hypothetical protein